MATIRIGPFVSPDGRIARDIVWTRNVYLWVHWDKDPGTAFDVTDLEFLDSNGNDASGRIRSLVLVARRENSFLFGYNFTGLEGIYSILIEANVFDNNPRTIMSFPIHGYLPTFGMRNWTVPATTVTSRTVSIRFT